MWCNTVLVRSQHTDLVEEFFEHFQDVISGKDTRWDNIIMEESSPENYIDAEEDFNGDIDLALLNGNEAFVMEFKTSSKRRAKGQKQLRKIKSYLERNGYENVRHSLYIEDRDDHMSPEELKYSINEELGGFFSRGDLKDLIEYSKGWSSFGHLLDNDTAESISNIDTEKRFHRISSPYNVDKLEERGIIASEVGKVYRFTPEFKDLMDSHVGRRVYAIKPEEL